MKRLAVNGRTEWRRIVREQGCSWYEDGKDGCWREEIARVLTQDEVELLTRNAAEVLTLYQQAAEYVVRRGLWSRLGIGEEAAVIIQASLERGDEALLGRFDFLMDESGQPRLLEFNADNALSLVETAVLQREWLRAVMPGKVQCNRLHESLVEAWRKRGVSRVHCAWRPRHAEVEGTVRYMASVVREAGLEAEMTALHCLGWHRGRKAFVDGKGQDVECLWKLYPWEWMLREPFGCYASSSRCRYVEPVWRLLPGNKGMLSVLWELFPDHPALLPCHDESPATGASWVAKPLLGREGCNVTVCRDGKVVQQTGGDFAEQRCVYQKFVAAPVQDGWLPQFGVWMVGSEPVAIGIRESDDLIITGDSPFVPHVIA